MGTGFPSGGGGEYNLTLQQCAKPGAIVKQGQTVAEFDRVMMLMRVDDYRTSVLQQEESVRKLQAEIGIARKAYDQKLEAAKADLDKARLDVKTTPVLSKIDSEKVKLAAEEAEARYQQVLAEKKFVETGYASQVKNAEIDLEQARLEWKRADMNASRMVVKSPINGLVVMQPIFRGAEFGQIQAGDQLWPGMMFMQIVDPSSMVMNAVVNQVDVERIRVGQKARIRVDAYPGLELPAHIHSIGAITRPGGQRASFVKEIPVVLKIDGVDARVIPDLSVSADVIIESENDTNVAPRQAIFRDGDASQAPYVYVRNGDVWDRRTVQLGVASATSVAVRSGLKPGDVVALEVPPLTKKGQG